MHEAGSNADTPLTYRGTHRFLAYFRDISRGKTILWCYLIWYLVTVFYRFDPTPAIWLNSAGISAVIGFALMLSVGGSAQKADRWQTFRLFMMPFGVSSFSSLIKGHGYILIFPSQVNELFWSVTACALFLLFVRILKLASARKLA